MFVSGEIKIRLDKFLSNCGFGSRSEVQRYIKSGIVKVNNQTVKDPSTKINPDIDVVSFDEEEIDYKEHYYFMLNKPAGYLTATTDEYEPTVIDLFSDFPAREKLFPVGRLDRDTEGLLIITTDGQFAHRIAHPKWNIEKEYFARVEGDVSGVDFSKFEEKGIYLKSDKYQTKPFRVEVISADREFSQISITVTEGKYHIVKKIMAQLGHPVVYLKRIRVAGLRLDEDLEPGEYRELTEEEIKSLKEAVNL